MHISLNELKRHVNQLSKELNGLNFYAPVMLNNDTYIFPIVEDKNKSLVISLNHQNPLIYIIKDDEFYSSFESRFYLRFRKLVQKSKFIDLVISPNDKIVSLTLEPIDEFASPIKLIIELIPLKPNLFITTLEGEILEFLKNDKRHLKIGDKYIAPEASTFNDSETKIDEELINRHYAHEIENRKKQKYQEFNTYINSKIKAINRKKDAIKKDKEIAKENLKYQDIATEILSLGLNLKSHVEYVTMPSGQISLDISKTIYENIDSFFKKAKKANETIRRNDENLVNADNELGLYLAIKNEFDNATSDKEKSEIISRILNKNKKKEAKETPFNIPYKLNHNGTIIYFGRNASQNDYLSFVMKLDREFIWMHIKDKSGAHLVIASKNPTEEELLFASEIALICSKAQSGEITYAKKKNVRRGHKLGEALVKNYSTIKLNNIRKETFDAFSKASRLK